MKRTVQTVYRQSPDNINMSRAKNNATLTHLLSEDVITLFNTQQRVLHDLITADSPSALSSSGKGRAMLLDGLYSILFSFQQTHINGRALFLFELQDSCAAANDWWRLSERLESFLENLSKEYPFLAAIEENVSSSSEKSSAQMVFRLGSELVSMLSQDSVQAAERVQLFILREVKQSSIPNDLFSLSWERDWTHNEVVIDLVNTFDRYLKNIQGYLFSDFLYHKVVISTAKALECFYVKSLVEKADSVSRRRRNDGNRFHTRSSECLQPFHNFKRVLIRMFDDIDIIRDFINEKATASTVLQRIVADELHILELIHECLGATDDWTSLESFILVIHKRTGADRMVTRYFVGDLWLVLSLGRRHDQKQIKGTLKALDPDLQMISSKLKQQRLAVPQQRQQPLGLGACIRLDEMLKNMYEDRIAQGILPLCWACIPKEQVTGEDELVVVKKLRSMSRTLAEMKLPK